MKIGIQLPYLNWVGQEEPLGKVAARLESIGFDSIWVMDHLRQVPKLGEQEDATYEAYTTLGYIAGATSHVKLGPLVVNPVMRHPAMLIKAATSLHLLSGERTYFAIGAGWFAEEAIGYGYYWPERAQRYKRLELIVRLARHMWSPLHRDPFNDPDLIFPMEIPANNPLPYNPPPIIIGGNGERKTIPLAARYADGVNFLALEPSAVARKLGVLHRECKRIGRNPATLEVSLLLPLGGHDLRAVEAIRGRLQIYRDMGVDRVIVNHPDLHRRERVANFYNGVLYYFHG